MKFSPDDSRFAVTVRPRRSIFYGAIAGIIGLIITCVGELTKILSLTQMVTQVNAQLQELDALPQNYPNPWEIGVILFLIVVPYNIFLGILFLSLFTTSLRVNASGMSWRRYLVARRSSWSQVWLMTKKLSRSYETDIDLSMGMFKKNKSIFVYVFGQKPFKIPADWFDSCWDPSVGGTSSLSTLLQNYWNLSRGLPLEGLQAPNLTGGETARGSDGKDADEWCKLGFARAQQGDYKGAAEAYEWALQLDPTKSIALENLEDALQHLREDP